MPIGLIESGQQMFVTFFYELKAAGVPVTLREYLTLLEAWSIWRRAASRISTICPAPRW